MRTKKERVREKRYRGREKERVTKTEKLSERERG